jgi:hypothetical protein
MVDNLRLYVEAIVAVGIMGVLSVVAAFVAAAITGDRMLVIAAAAAAFVITGAVLMLRLWRMPQKSVLPLDPGT